MATIDDVLRTKGSAVHVTSPDSTVFDAISRMVELNIGSLLVVDEDGDLVGIMTERDYLRKVALLGRTSRTTPVSEIMTSGVLTVSRWSEVDDCLTLMTQRRIRHLPVIERGRTIGVVSVGDLVKQKLNIQRFEIEQLTAYIQGAVT
jgi:signal-transduction protein with cAMP-binding, CBS, and nucleotidyltransferase domain